MRRFLTLCAILLAAPSGAATYKLQSSDFTYEGFFRFPNVSAYNSDMSSITYADDCMGETDPSPSDGYPGCIMGVDGGNVSMCDIVPPTAAGSNTCTSVFSGWDVEGGAFDTYTPSVEREMQIHYDNTGSPCRVVWVIYSEYANNPADDANVFGYSDCSLTTPNPQGMYRWTSQADADTTIGDPYDAHKYAYHVRRIPAGIATDYFSGNAMALGPGKSHGSRGSSAGPSLAIRPWTFPTDAGGWDELVPILWYTEATESPRWYITSKFRNADDTQYNRGDNIAAAEWIRISSGGDNYEALVFIGNVGVVDSNVYPLSDPSAKPTEGTYTTETYQSPGAYGWPDPDVVPVFWYGVQSYVAPYDQQDPSFNDFQSDGTRMPGDSNLVSFCTHGTGPSTQASRTRIWMYEAAEIGAMYQGTSGYANDEIQPYDQITLAFDPGNDGFDTEKDTCAQTARNLGHAYAADQQLLFIVVGPNPTGSSAPYSTGTRRGVVVYSVSPAAQQESSKTLEGTTLSGGSVNQ